MSEPKVYQYEDLTYIRLSELPEAEAARLDEWTQDQTRPVIPGLELQDAVYSWDYTRWKRRSDPVEQLMQEITFGMVDESEYSAEEIEQAKRLAFIEMEDVPWQLYLPAVREMNEQRQRRSEVPKEHRTWKSEDLGL